MSPTSFLHDLKRLKNMADIGHLYATNEFDKERYAELQEMALRWMGELGDHSLETLKLTFPAPTDYPTPKVDVRGLLLSPDKTQVLMVKESVDGRWALPGGWADIGSTPNEMMVREFREEAGLEVRVVRLLAVYDKSRHPHPPEAFYVYKLYFLCTEIAGSLSHGHDMLGVQYFDIGSLPPLSEARNTRQQIEHLHCMVLEGRLETEVD